MKSSKNKFLNQNISGIAKHMIIKKYYSFKTKNVLFNSIIHFNLNDIILTKDALK